MDAIYYIFNQNFGFEGYLTNIFPKLASTDQIETVCLLFLGSLSTLVWWFAASLTRDVLENDLNFFKPSEIQQQNLLFYYTRYYVTSPVVFRRRVNFSVFFSTITEDYVKGIVTKTITNYIKKGWMSILIIYNIS